MNFQTQVTINRRCEKLKFISWGGDTITHFVIIGLSNPLAMAGSPSVSSWVFVEEVCDELKGYEKIFSDIINKHLHQNGETGCSPHADADLSYA
jgi:hypothetical protein